MLDFVQFITESGLKKIIVLPKCNLFNNNILKPPELLAGKTLAEVIFTSIFLSIYLLTVINNN